MAQRTEGLFRLVGIPYFYKAFQSGLGADRARKTFIGEFARPKAGMRVLDVGCGPGILFPYLPEVDYTGIDLNAKHIEAARARYGAKGRFLAGNAAGNLELEEDSFDLIIVSALLHHLNDDEARSLMSQLVRLVPHGGRIATLDQVWLPEQHVVARVLNRLDSGQNVRTPEGYQSLVDGLPVDVECKVFRNLIRLPYDYFCMALTRR